MYSKSKCFILVVVSIIVTLIISYAVYDYKQTVRAKDNECRGTFQLSEASAMSDLFLSIVPIDDDSNRGEYIIYNDKEAKKISEGFYERFDENITYLFEDEKITRTLIRSSDGFILVDSDMSATNITKISNAAYVYDRN